MFALPDVVSASIVCVAFMEVVLSLMLVSTEVTEILNMILSYKSYFAFNDITYIYIECINTYLYILVCENYIFLSCSKLVISVTEHLVEVVDKLSTTSLVFFRSERILKCMHLHGA